MSTTQATLKSESTSGTSSSSSTSNTIEPGSVRYYIEAFLLAQQVRGNSPNTVRYYREDLKRFVWFLKNQGYPSQIQDITPSTIRHFFVYLQTCNENRWGSTAPNANRPLTAGTVHGFARAVRAFFRWVIVEADLPKNPLQNVSMPKVPNAWQVQVFDDAQITALFSAWDNLGSQFAKQRARCILSILLDAGLRASECLSLDLNSIDEQRVFSVCGKGVKERMCAIGNFAVRELWHYLQLRKTIRTDIPTLFVSSTGKPMTYWALRTLFDRLKTLSGISVKGGAHLCRHTSASAMYRNGMRGASLQEFLGHNAFDTTRKYYLHLAKEELAREHKRYAPLDNLREQIRPIQAKSLQLGRVLNENGRWVPALPPAETLALEVSESNYSAVARKYGVSDTAIRKRLRSAGLL